ncbi:hypothetical protein EVAR_32508_1 [Eumeta japonica]|uniref:Uncharacterized protein n=1 Tax=Eumeta variegata TaxID=151549 RepID=A0A4C1W8Y4_EUMVA|nr:hypothetical protein EVAR_32508_1 [Eumeta japonica]
MIYKSIYINRTTYPRPRSMVETNGPAGQKPPLLGPQWSAHYSALVNVDKGHKAADFISADPRRDSKCQNAISRSLRFSNIKKRLNRNRTPLLNRKITAG